MKDLMKEIELLIAKLRTKLPESNLRKSTDKLIPGVGARKETVTAEMAALEEQLRSIERDFSKINV